MNRKNVQGVFAAALRVRPLQSQAGQGAGGLTVSNTKLLWEPEGFRT